MNESIAISKTLDIGECGKDEYWLQDQIAGNPGILGLGDLEVVRREKLQSSGGKLDLLLKDPEDDTMYEVEVMLGATDESHIIRTIEYWDLERRRWPQRQHFAVLIAEAINRRFFNVIRLLSDAVPIIAIQANLIEAEGKKALHFTTILDACEEPEDETGESEDIVDESRWRSRYPATLDTAKALLAAVQPIYGEMDLVFAKTYMVLRVGIGQFWLHPSHGKTYINIYLDEADQSAVGEAFGQANISFRMTPKAKNGHEFSLKGIDEQLVKTHADLFRRVAKFVKKWND